MNKYGEYVVRQNYYGNFGGKRELIEISPDGTQTIVTLPDYPPTAEKYRAVYTFGKPERVEDVEKPGRAVGFNVDYKVWDWATAEIIESGTEFFKGRSEKTAQTQACYYCEAIANRHKFKEVRRYEGNN